MAELFQAQSPYNRFGKHPPPINFLSETWVKAQKNHDGFPTLTLSLLPKHEKHGNTHACAPQIVSPFHGIDLAILSRSEEQKATRWAAVKPFER